MCTQNTAFFLADKTICPLHKSCLPDGKRKDEEQDLEHSAEELRFGKLHKSVAHVWRCLLAVPWRELHFSSILSEHWKSGVSFLPFLTNHGRKSFNTSNKTMKQLCFYNIIAIVGVLHAEKDIKKLQD